MRPRAVIWRPLTGLALAAALLTEPRPASAQTHELERVEPLTLSIELGSALVLFGGALLVPPPDACRWCNPPGFDEALASPAPESRRRVVAQLSHVVSGAVVPALALSALIVPPFVSSAEPDIHAFENVMIMGESVMLDMAITHGIKKWVARRRPAFYYGRAGSTEFSDKPGEENVSFFSGDTSLPFAATASAATIGFMRGYPSAPYVAVAGGVLSAAVAVMRVRADVHWPSDVITGALVGTAVGVAVPLLLHPRAQASTTVGERPLLLTNVAADSVRVDFFGTF